MSTRNLIVFTILELAVAIVVALASHRLFHSQGEHVLFGLGLFVMLLIIHMLVSIHELGSRSERLRGVLDALRADDGFSELLLIHSPRPLNLAGRDHLTVPPNAVRMFWKDCVSRAQQSWRAVSYTRGDDTWLLSWAKWAQAIQQERLASKCRIERMFVFDTPDELEAMKQLMRDQAASGVAVRWLMRAEINMITKSTDWISSVGSLDFALIDGDWAFVTDLDAQRQIRGATATRKTAARDAARDLFGELWQLAESRKQIVA